MNGRGFGTVLMKVGPRSPLGRRLAAGTGALLFLAACAQAPEQTLRAPGDTFNVYAAEETFVAGFDVIAEKYIDGVSVAAVVLEGLKGIQSVDPSLSVTRDGARLILTHAGQPVADFPAPADHDAAAWGQRAAQISLAARTASPDMREAPAEKVYEAIFDGTLSNLDIFSRYAGKEEAARNRSRRDGFGGVGIRFKLDGEGPVVTHVQSGGPADKAGLQAGDRITHIDGTPIGTGGIALNAVSDHLRGQENSSIIVTVRRAAEPTSVSFLMTRTHVVPESVETRIVGDVMVAKISRFNRDTPAELVRDLKAQRDALGSRLKGVVLDLRGNPGGLLKQSVTVADLFLTQGDILDTKGRHPASLQHYAAGGRDFAGGLPVVVLIDGKSASAAEIVASALQDRGRAAVVGTTSYGKGSVQTVQRLPNDGELTVTWSRFVTPTGYTLHGLGVFPTVCTSGLDAPDAALDRAIGRSMETARTLVSWRHSVYGESGPRAALRAICPPESRTAGKTGDVDLAVAVRLIDTPRSYAHARLLAVEPPASTAAAAE